MVSPRRRALRKSATPSRVHSNPAGWRSTQQQYGGTRAAHRKGVHERDVRGSLGALERVGVVGRPRGEIGRDGAVDRRSRRVVAEDGGVGGEDAARHGFRVAVAVVHVRVVSSHSRAVGGFDVGDGGFERRRGLVHAEHLPGGHAGSREILEGFARTGGVGVRLVARRGETTRGETAVVSGRAGRGARRWGWAREDVSAFGDERRRRGEGARVDVAARAARQGARRRERRARGSRDRRGRRRHVAIRARRRVREASRTHRHSAPSRTS